ncbi:uncharacterized protein LOC116619360 [Nematostella vectensis]|uniref:uncharacterized protein LOC116619360 n=1 Tax=Nematostella vectensis TaxID=45351 RepID=UPI002076EF7C|nr:uncharacterized protein LOC116619360 [Nematostella vectensis]
MTKISTALLLLFSALLHVQGEWRKINYAPVCFEGRGNRPGHLMYAGGTGHLVGAMKLEWRSGVMRCVSDVAHNSKWGCYQHNSFKSYPFNVIVTDSSDEIIYPSPEYIKHWSGLWYYLPSQDEKESDALVFSDFESPFYLRPVMELKLWYGEDLKDWSETDNQGRVCVDVFIWPVVEPSMGENSSSISPASGAEKARAIGILTDLKTSLEEVINKKW